MCVYVSVFVHVSMCVCVCRIACVQAYSMCEQALGIDLLKQEQSFNEVDKARTLIPYLFKLQARPHRISQGYTKLFQRDVDSKEVVNANSCIPSVLLVSFAGVGICQNRKDFTRRSCRFRLGGLCQPRVDELEICHDLFCGGPMILARWYGCCSSSH
jgi:hypothetical protein